jgi:tetratricopeptide (TPR) repeat protein
LSLNENTRDVNVSVKKDFDSHIDDRDSARCIPAHGIWMAERATTLHTLGKVLRLRSQFQDSRKHLLAALEMRKALDSRADIADTFHELGVLSLRRHAPRAAEEYLRESLRLKEEVSQMRSNGDPSGVALTSSETSVAATMHQLAVVATTRQQYVEAEKLLLDVLALESNGGAGRNVIISSSTSKSGGRASASVDVSATVTTTQNMPMPPPMPPPMPVSKDVAALHQLGSLDSLRTTARDGDASNRKSADAKHALKATAHRSGRKASGCGLLSSLSRAATLQQLGRVGVRLGKLEEAEARLQEALNIYSKVYGERRARSHINVAAVHYQLGSCLSAMHRYEEASAHYSVALSIRTTVYADDEDGGDHTEIVSCLQALGQAELDRGQLNSAEALFTREYEMANRLLVLVTSEVPDTGANASTMSAQFGVGKSDSPTFGTAAPTTDEGMRDEQVEFSLRQRRQRQLFKSLEFSVYSLRGIARKRGDHLRAIDLHKRAQEIRKLHSALCEDIGTTSPPGVNAADDCDNVINSSQDGVLTGAEKAQCEGLVNVIIQCRERTRLVVRDVKSLSKKLAAFHSAKGRPSVLPTDSAGTSDAMGNLLRQICSDDASKASEDNFIARLHGIGAELRCTCSSLLPSSATQSELPYVPVLVQMVDSFASQLASSSNALKDLWKVYGTKVKCANDIDDVGDGAPVAQCEAMCRALGQVTQSLFGMCDEVREALRKLGFAVEDKVPNK